MNTLFILYVFIFFCGCYCGNEVPVNPNAIGFKKEYYETNNEHCKSGDYDCNHYVDPHDMRNYVHSTKSMQGSKQRNCRQTVSGEKGCENCAMYLQRFVGLFLGATGLKDYVLTRSNSKMVNLNLVVKQNELEILQKFVETGDIDLSVINSALTNILTGGGDTLFNDQLQRNRFEDYSYYVIDTGRQLFHAVGMHALENPLHFIIICVTSVFGITLWQIVKTRSFVLLLFSLWFILFSAGFGWTWYRMYKLAAIEKFTNRILNTEEIPIYCRPDQMTWYQYVYYWSHEKDCEAYFKKQMIDPFVEISPLQVLAETLSTFVLYPIDKLGTSMGGFIRGLTTGLPWYWNIVFVPFSMLLITVVIVMIGSVLLGGRIKGRFFPFASIEIGSFTGNKRRLCCGNSRKNDELIENVQPMPISDRDETEIEKLPEAENTQCENTESCAKTVTKVVSPKVPERNRKEVAALLERWKRELIDEQLDTPSVESSSDSVIVSVNNSSKSNKAINVNINLPGSPNVTDVKNHKEID